MTDLFLLSNRMIWVTKTIDLMLKCSRFFKKKENDENNDLFLDNCDLK